MIDLHLHVDYHQPEAVMPGVEEDLHPEEEILHQEDRHHEEALLLHEAEAAGNEEVPLHQEEATLLREELTLHQRDEVRHLEEAHLHQDEMHLHHGELDLEMLLGMPQEMRHHELFLQQNQLVTMDGPLQSIRRQENNLLSSIKI